MSDDTSTPSTGEAPDEAHAEAPTATPTATPTTGPTLDQARLALRRVKDPELNLNIVDLGLVYDIQVAGPVVTIDMSLTSPGCPSGPEIMHDAEKQLRSLDGVD